ncbi:hypothetical protein SAMN05661093_07037 [Kibdelosporangium aridum]|uniref:Uncharacterized protein n=1 Tax=Kibdelosporangium aridum TaxID=2030 RepID=A0A1Y5XYR8_KIBAR|nr:hypothetical protein SAMN05661093_07037 [Kibdelosporangium aridum]
MITGDVNIVRTEISSNVTADDSAAFPGGEPGPAGAAGAGGGIATTPFASQPTIFELRNGAAVTGNCAPANSVPGCSG